MEVQLDHVAVNTANFEETVHFFEELFGMEIDHIKGQAPERKLWFKQGIQINETAQIQPGGNRYDHIGFRVPDWQETRRQAAEMGCAEVAGKPHWFVTPDNLVIELMR